MATAVKPYSKTARKRAAKILQKAHDLIERDGFDIQDWGFRDSDGQISGPFCYIGAVRAAANLNPYPENNNAGAGDGPELILAFEVLDELARKRFPRVREWLQEDRPADFEFPIGRYVETLGFAVERQLAHKYSEDDPKRDRLAKRDAKALLRKALTELYESGDLQ